MTVFGEPQASAKQEHGGRLTPRFDGNGLVAAIAVDHCSRDVLMVAWMNEDALRRTLETGLMHYWSRSRNCLWLKGETSGQTQSIVRLSIDCDQDAILAEVDVGGDGGACHTGARSCFYRLIEPDLKNPSESRLIKK